MKFQLLIGLHELLCNSLSFEKRSCWCALVLTELRLVWQAKCFFILSSVTAFRNKLHEFLCMCTQCCGILSLTAHAGSTCKTLKSGNPWQASEYLKGQDSSTYSCVIPVTAGSYCCDKTVILVERNQKDLNDTHTKVVFFFCQNCQTHMHNNIIIRTLWRCKNIL